MGTCELCFGRFYTYTTFQWFVVKDFDFKKYYGLRSKDTKTTFL